ncbi:hypothetical protein EON68_02115, partial [archaeon]
MAQLAPSHAAVAGLRYALSCAVCRSTLSVPLTCDSCALTVCKICQTRAGAGTQCIQCRAAGSMRSNRPLEAVAHYFAGLEPLLDALATGTGLSARRASAQAAERSAAAASAAAAAAAAAALA